MPEEITSGIWKQLIGGSELNNNNRIVNAALIISLVFIATGTIVDILSGLIEPMIINIILIITFGMLYNISRYRKAYKACFIIYAICSYVILITTFFYSAGIHGPTMFLFFVTFYLLIAISPSKLHVVWTVLHICIGFTLIYIGHYYPNAIKSNYTTQNSIFVDMVFTYIVSLFFLYLITMQLQKKYEQEKKLSQSRNQLILQKAKLIARQHTKLNQISSVQSHEVRSKVATIWGLSELIDCNNLSNPANLEVLEGIKYSVKELDEVIKKINELAK